MTYSPVRLERQPLCGPRAIAWLRRAGHPLPVRPARTLSACTRPGQTGPGNRLPRAPICGATATGACEGALDPCIAGRPAVPPVGYEPCPASKADNEPSAEYALPVYGKFALGKWHRIVISVALLTPVLRPRDVSQSPRTDELRAVPGGVISASGPGGREIGGDALAGRWDATIGHWHARW
jgi:hypothetical protein